MQCLEIFLTVFLWWDKSWISCKLHVIHVYDRIFHSYLVTCIDYGTCYNTSRSFSLSQSGLYLTFFLANSIYVDPSRLISLHILRFPLQTCAKMSLYATCRSLSEPHIPREDGSDTVT